MRITQVNDNHPLLSSPSSSENTNFLAVIKPQDAPIPVNSVPLEPPLETLELLKKTTATTITTTIKHPKVFICPKVHCGKQFPRAFALRRHMRIHTGTKPYTCDYLGCLQRFNTSGNLSRHKRIHSGERPYPCLFFDTCGKRFNTSTKLKRHMRVHFPDGPNVFRCSGQHVHCKWSCDNYKDFTQHQKIHHPDRHGGDHHQQHHHPVQDLRPFTAPSNAGTPEIMETNDNNGYFLTAEASREDTTDQVLYAKYRGSTSSNGNHLLCPSTVDQQPKSSSMAVPPWNKHLGLPAYFGSSDDNVSSLPTMLPKEPRKTSILTQPYGLEPQHRIKMNGSSAFGSSVHYGSTNAAFAIGSDSSFCRPSSSSSTNYFAPLRTEDKRDDSSYEQHQRQQQLMLPLSSYHVLRPPPQSGNTSKYNGCTVSAPLHSAAPEFTGEELSAVLQLMNETY